MLVNQKIEESQNLNSQDIISLGTTSFIILDRASDSSTIVSVSQPPGALFSETGADKKDEKLNDAKNLKDIFI